MGYTYCESTLRTGLLVSQNHAMALLIIVHKLPAANRLICESLDLMSHPDPFTSPFHYPLATNPLRHCDLTQTFS